MLLNAETDGYWTELYISSNTPADFKGTVELTNTLELEHKHLYCTINHVTVGIVNDEK